MTTDNQGWSDGGTFHSIKMTRPRAGRWGSLVEVWRHGRRILRIPAPAFLIRWINRNDTRSCM